MTDDLGLAALRAGLPPVYRNLVAVPAEWAGAPRLVIDLEWDPNDPMRLTCVGVGNRKAVVQLWWQELSDLARDAARGWVAMLVRTVPVTYHNADIDIRMMRRHGFGAVLPQDHRQLDDTMLMHAAYDSEWEHTLDVLCMEYGKLPPHKHLAKTHPVEYNAGDVVETDFVADALAALLVLDPGAAKVYRMKLDILPEIIAGNERGIAVDPLVAYELRDAYTPRVEQGQKLAQAYCGFPINLSSPDQLLHQFYNVEGFPVQYKRAAPGEEPPATTDKDALAVLRRLQGTEWDDEAPATLDLAVANIDAGGHPLLEAKYLYSGAKQRLSHYVLPCFDGDAPKARIYPETRIHAQETGRHSIVSPALQQFKRREEYLIRPDAGWPWLIFDWSNIETWLLGYLAGDELILEAKRQGWDTHTVNLCDLLGIAYPADKTKRVHTCPCSDCTWWRGSLTPVWAGDDDIRRTFSKRCIYRTHYLGDPTQMADIPGARSLGMDGKTMTAAVNRYLDRHHWIREYWAETSHLADTVGIVRDFMGGPRRLTSQGRNARRREAANNGLQMGVARIYDETIALVKAALPHARFVYGKHDAHCWALPEETFTEDAAVVRVIAERHFTINGYDAFFPASWKERRA